MAAGSLAADYTNPIPQPCSAEPAHHVRVQFENDSAVDTDEKYTHGTRLEYMNTQRKGFSLGCSMMQNIYTPLRHTTHANPGEHPYAGVLALGAIAQAGSDVVGVTSELQLGVMGKHSYAKECQNNLHSACGMDTWDGWQDQIPSEMAVQSSTRFDLNVPLNSPYADGLVFERTELGNLRIATGIGAAFRMGKNLPRNNQVIGSRAGNVGTGALERRLYDPAAPSYYLLAQAEVSYVARDFAIDGGMFHHFDQPCSRTPWQGQLTFGAGAARKGIDYFAGVVLSSKSYRAESHEHLYGTFSVQWNW